MAVLPNTSLAVTVTVVVPPTTMEVGVALTANELATAEVTVIVAEASWVPSLAWMSLAIPTVLRTMEPKVNTPSSAVENV